MLRAIVCQHDKVVPYGMYIITHLKYIKVCSWVGVMGRIIVLNATFNSFSDISWRSVLLVDKTGVPEENHRPVAGH